MPRHFKATDIPMAIRRPHLARYTRQLRDALHSPALTKDQRGDIKDRIANVGGMKPYAKLAARSAVRLAAARGEEPIEVTLVEEEPPLAGKQTLDDLLGLTKTGLIDLASEENVTVVPSWTKSKIAVVILNARDDG